jgi:hypothetical protein
MAADNISLNDITQYHSCHVLFVTKQAMAPDLYLWAPQLKSWPGHWLSWEVL